MSAIEFVKNNPYFHETQAPQKAAWVEVFEQAIEHTRNVKQSKLTAKARPNEPTEIMEYRDDNKRQITKADVEKYRTKTSRIYKSSGLSINQASLSDVLKEHLETNPYNYIGAPIGVMEYAMNVVYTRSIDDPNAVTIEFPYNRENPEIPPVASSEDGGLAGNKRVDCQTIVVSHSDIVYFSKELFSWYGGQWVYTREGNRDVSAAFYWIVDKENFYQWIPVGKEKGKIKYELIFWYPHNTGIGEEKVLPVNLLLGVLAFDESEEFAYQNSILHGYFELADEFKSKYSDAQGVWINFSSPVKVVQATKCSNPECQKGKIKQFDSQTGELTGYSKCNDCDGEGRNYTASPYGYYVKKEVRGEESIDSKPYEIIGAQSDAVQTSHDISFDVLDKARRAIGLDVLLGYGESGTAKEKHLEDTRDKLADNAEKIKTWLENHLFFKECLLVFDRNERKIPAVNVPVDFDLKSSADYRKEAQDALPNDRIEKELNYYRSVYKNNERLLKVYEIALSNFPYLVVEWNQVKEREALAIISNEDIVKTDNVVAFLRKFSEADNWLDLSEEQVLQLYDAALIEAGLIEPPIDVEVKTKSKLLETVGGVKGIIEISTAIANGQMTSDAGIALLQSVFNFSIEDAQKIASVPQIPQEPQNPQIAHASPSTLVSSSLERYSSVVSWFNAVLLKELNSLNSSNSFVGVPS